MRRAPLGPRLLRSFGGAAATMALAGVVLAGMVLARPAGAHEHWVDLDEFRPAAGDTVRVTARSGHYFPKKGHALAAKVVRGVTARLPDGQVRDLAITEGDKQWEGALGPLADGVHVFTLTLQRARAPRPRYEARAIAIAGVGPDDAAAYAVGSGLELVPRRPLTQLRPGQSLPVALTLDGEPVAGEVTAVPTGGRTSSAKATAQAPAVLDIRVAGRYLLSASAGGRGCSLVFDVDEDPEVGQ